MYPWSLAVQRRQRAAFAPAVRAFLPARRFVAWNALRLADDGDALDAAIDKLVVPVLPQLRDDLVRQLFLQRSCIFNCHLESSYLKGVQNNV